MAAHVIAPAAGVAPGDATPDLERLRAFAREGSPGPHAHVVLLGLNAFDAHDVLRAVNKGLPYRVLERLARNTGLSIDAILGLIDVPRRTLTRRKVEGRFLAADLDSRLATLLTFVDTVEKAAASGQAALEGRLRDRLAALPSDLQLDPTAVTQEVVRFVARSDIHEEVSRMRGHVEHWRQLADGPEPCGRKLDFLVQEMNREINTIGSKAEGLKVTELVVGAKAELERVREQVQNVE